MTKFCQIAKVWNRKTNMLRPLLFAMFTFVFLGAIVGQVIMHGQGDTAVISIRYGFLYVVTGCGLPDLLRGQIQYLLPVICELVPAAIVFCIFRYKTKSQK
jgi:hypothetical protein